MIIYSTNIWALPLLFIALCIDFFIFLVGLRLLLTCFHGAGANRLRQELQQFTDPVPQKVAGWICSCYDKSPPSWLPWILVLVSFIIVRHLLLMIVFFHP